MEKDLIQRLEAAVVRLEVISVSAGSFSRGGGAADDDATAAAASTVVDPAIVAFEELIEKSVGRVVVGGEKIGGRVADASKLVQEAFAVQKELLVRVKQMKKPDTPGLQEFLKPLNEVILKANTLTEGRRPDYFNHLKTAADSLTALAWIAYTGKDCGMSLPISHVEECWQMAEFYNNKILVEYRNKDPDHVEWAKALKEVYLPGLRDFVKSFYPLGPVWSATASGPTSGSSPSPTTSKASSSKTPAVPPPPPCGSLTGSEAAPARPKVGMSAVFQEINSGKPATAGLRKVTSDMKTKNQTDKTGVVSAATSEKEAPRASSFSFKTGPPKLELQMGRKWAVENQVGKKSLVIDDCDSKQSVYIFGCKDSVLQVKGKVNNITIDKCTKVGILFMDVVSACEVVNCSGIEVQCQGSAPTISVDNTSGCQLYLSKGSLGTSITSSKSSEINVMVPDFGPDNDWRNVYHETTYFMMPYKYLDLGGIVIRLTPLVILYTPFPCPGDDIAGEPLVKEEHTLPHQFVHTFKNGLFITSPASHSGG